MEISSSLDAEAVPARTITDRLKLIALSAGWRIVAATPDQWPALFPLSADDMATADDTLIRLALWTASRMSTALMGTRRATLWNGELDIEIRCLVLGIARLKVRRPLSGFLLKPMDIIEQRFLQTPARGTHRPSRPGGNEMETRLALLDAFPVEDPEEQHDFGLGPAP